MAPKWTKMDIPPQNGKIVIITGATGGLGLETALYFAKTGATVIVVGRNEEKGKTAVDKILAKFPESAVVFGKVNLASLASIAEFASWFLGTYQLLDILINNAAVVVMEKREVTEDGFDMHMGTNHLAPFALTAQLLPALRKSSAPRVVNIASMEAHMAKLNFDNFQFQKKFGGLDDYATTKLCNLLFTLELQRKSDQHKWGLFVVAAHPGSSNTEGSTRAQNSPSFGKLMRFLVRNMQHSAEDGALCTLYAATAKNTKKGGYYGPQNMFGVNGPPGPARIPGPAKNKETAKKLWEISEQLTKVTYPTV